MDCKGGSWVSVPRHISSGSFTDVSIPQKDGQQASSIELRRGKDAVCLAYASTALAEGNDPPKIFLCDERES
jgi:hypothetical protein